MLKREDELTLVVYLLMKEREQHIQWIYALRYLRVALALKLGQTQETLVAISQLKIIATLANGRRDSAIAATASAIEALVHAGRSNNPENIEQAQTALATARSSQLDPLARGIPQLMVMMHFVDLCCSLHQDDLDQAGAKMALLHSTLDGLANDHTWKDSGHILVPIRPHATRVKSGVSLGGVIESDNNGNSLLVINWLPKDEIYTLGYLLSAAVVVHKNPQDGRAEEFLREALGMFEFVHRVE